MAVVMIFTAVAIESTSNAAKEININDGACALVLDDKVTKQSDECAGCAEKDIQREYWETKYNDLLKLYEIQGHHNGNECETKYKELKKVYLNQSHHFSELNIKYTVQQTTLNSCQPDGNAVHAYNDDIFSPQELKILQNMSLYKKKDSTFIHQCLEYAYKIDLSVLSRKTLKGKAESVKFSLDGQEECVPKKDPLSPEKVNRIKELLLSV